MLSDSQCSARASAKRDKQIDLPARLRAGRGLSRVRAAGPRRGVQLGRPGPPALQLLKLVAAARSQPRNIILRHSLPGTEPPALPGSEAAAAVEIVVPGHAAAPQNRRPQKVIWKLGTP